MPTRPTKKQRMLRLICWNEADAATRAAELRRYGYRVIAAPPESGGGMIQHFRELAPDAVVIDMNRLPAQGRELGRGLRASRTTYQLPLIFAGGLAAKVDLVRELLPDAVFSSWDDSIAAAIERAIDQPPSPGLRAAETPKEDRPGALERKLDIKPQTHFVIVHADGADISWLAELLTTAPEGAVQQPRMDATTTLVLSPVATRRELNRAFEQLRKALPAKASLWIVHPKQTSMIAADFNQNDVREAGLAYGFVDYKVCAVNKDWSALKFARRGVTKAKSHAMR